MTEVLPLNTSPLPVRLRIEDYLLLDASGAFEPYAKTELIDGEILFMNAQHRPHARTKMDLYDAIRDALRASASPLRAFVEASIAIPDHSAPEPDIVLTREPGGDGLIPASSVALVIEVADTTMASDSGRKALLYARAGIPEYWIADVNAEMLQQMWMPTDVGYGKRRMVALAARIEAITFDLPPFAIRAVD